MIDITILHWRISPYFICFLLSFVLAYLYVTWYLKKAGVKGSHNFYSELLNTVLALYFGAFYTFIVQLAEQGKVETFGFSSLGGMAGILLGVWIFTKICNELAVAVKEGGSADPANNSRLRDAIAKAKANNMPNDTIERGIKKAAGDADSVNYEQITYEGYGPSGTAIIVKCLTDNKNRTAANV